MEVLAFDSGLSRRLRDIAAVPCQGSGDILGLKFVQQAILGLFERHGEEEVVGRSNREGGEGTGGRKGCDGDEIFSLEGILRCHNDAPFDRCITLAPYEYGDRLESWMALNSQSFQKVKMLAV